MSAKDNPPSVNPPREPYCKILSSAMPSRTDAMSAGYAQVWKVDAGKFRFNGMASTKLQWVLKTPQRWLNMRQNLPARHETIMYTPDCNCTEYTLPSSMVCDLICTTHVHTKLRYTACCAAKYPPRLVLLRSQHSERRRCTSRENSEYFAPDRAKQVICDKNHVSESRCALCPLRKI